MPDLTEELIESLTQLPEQIDAISNDLFTSHSEVMNSLQGIETTLLQINIKLDEIVSQISFIRNEVR